MIDLESDIFDAVAKAIESAHAGVTCGSTYNPSPAKLPFVSIVEADNRVNEQMRTTNIENAVIVMYECNIYTNKPSNRKAEAKAIAATMDAKFAEIGFTRTLKSETPNFNDVSIYRLTCRYEAVIDKDFWIYSN